MMQTNRDLRIVYIISFVDLFAVGLTVPLFSNHLLDLGASHFTIGVLTSIYSGLQVISGPFIGSWSDVRNRRSVLRITLLSCSIAYVILGFTKSIIIIGIIRFILGLTKHTQSISKAIITDIVPPKERADAFGRSAAGSTLGFIIGPILGGHLSEFQNGFQYVCLLTSFLFIINIILTSVLQETNNKVTKSKNDQSLLTKCLAEFRKSVFEIGDIDWLTLWDAFILRFIFGFAITLFFSQQSVYLKEHFKLSQKYIGYTISFYSALGTASAFLISYITRLYKNDDSCYTRLSHFFLIMSLSSIGLGFAPNIQFYLVCLIPFAISTIILRIVSMELLLRKDVQNHRGSLSGTSNSIMSIARFLTPLSSGLITDQVGTQFALISSALPSFVGAVIAARMALNNRIKGKAD